MRGLGKGVKSFKQGVDEAKEEINKAKEEMNELGEKKHREEGVADKERTSGQPREVLRRGLFGGLLVWFVLAVAVFLAMA